MSILNGSVGKVYLEPESTFTPTDIASLQLWLDASDSSTITVDGSNNVSAWIDKAQLDAEYLTSGSWSNSTDTVNDWDSITSISSTAFNAVTTSGVNAFGGSSRVFNLVLGDTYRITFDFTVNSGSPTMFTRFSRNNTDFSAARSNEVSFSGSGSKTIYLTCSIADSTSYLTFYTSDTCDISISNMSIRKVPNTFYQTTGADQPLWDGSSKITFDGVSEYMENDASFFSSVTTECYTFVRFKPLEPSAIPLNIDNSGDTNDFWYTHISGTNAAFQSRNGADTGIGAGDTTVSNTGTTYNILWGGNGTAFYLNVDGTVQTITMSTGSDDGDINKFSPAPDRADLARFVGSTVYNIEIEQVLFFNASLTSGDITNLFNYF